MVVLTGSGLSQIIPIAALPVITRLLPPAELGPYFIWIAAVSVLSIIFSLRLDIAIFNTKTTYELCELIQTSIFCASALACVTYFGIDVFSIYFQDLADQWMINEWRVEALMLASIWSVNMVVQNAYIYGAYFKRQAMVRVIQAASVAIAQIAAVLVGWGVKGMIICQTLVTLIIVLWNIIDLMGKYKINFPTINVSSLRNTFRQHWRFPVFSMPADFVSSVSGQLPVFLTGSRFGAESAGQISLTNKALAAPMRLLAGSVLSVFKEEAAREYRETGRCDDIFKKTFKSLLLIGVLPFTVLFFFVDSIFELLFGAQWRVAGEYGSILVPMFFFQFLSSPLSYVLYIANKQLQDLIWQIVVILVTLYIFLTTKDVKAALTAYSASYSFLYSIYLYMSYQSSKGKLRGV
ncbi:MAG: oligosaccharide flippase family protein [Pseudomonadales bacterium]|nr:oligosaccharide flippase family protein [Pseudomonadales bacterium]